MNRTIAATQDDHLADEAVPGLVAWLESHLQQYTDAVRAMGNRDAAPRYLR